MVATILLFTSSEEDLLLYSDIYIYIYNIYTPTIFQSYIYIYIYISASIYLYFSYTISQKPHHLCLALDFTLKTLEPRFFSFFSSLTQTNLVSGSPSLDVSNRSFTAAAFWKSLDGWVIIRPRPDRLRSNRYVHSFLIGSGAIDPLWV